MGASRDPAPAQDRGERVYRSEWHTIRWSRGSGRLQIRWEQGGYSSMIDGDGRDICGYCGYDTTGFRSGADCGYCERCGGDYGE